MHLPTSVFKECSTGVCKEYFKQQNCMLLIECIVFNSGCSSKSLPWSRILFSFPVSRGFPWAAVVRVLTTAFTLDYMETLEIHSVRQDQGSELHSQFSVEGIIKCRVF